jgi:3-oxoacyl-[acyl-carrier-protein] synthase III
MAKLKTKRAAPDRGKISMENDAEVKYWTKHLEITRERLQSIVEKVGNSAASVRKELAAQTNSMKETGGDETDSR